MATSSTPLGGWSVEVWTDPIEITSLGPELDPRWTYTDGNGHIHTNEPITYVWVQDEPDYFVDDGDGYVDEMPGRGHYECPICHERLVPGVRYDNTRRYMPGLTHATATTPDGQTIDLSSDDLARIEGSDPDGVVAVLESLVSTDPLENERRARGFGPPRG